MGRSLLIGKYLPFIRPEGPSGWAAVQKRAAGNVWTICGRLAGFERCHMAATGHRFPPTLCREGSASFCAIGWVRTRDEESFAHEFTTVRGQAAIVEDELSV